MSGSTVTQKLFENFQVLVMVCFLSWKANYS